MIKRFGKFLSREEVVKEKLDLLFTGYNQMQKVINDNRNSIEKIRHYIKDLSRNIETHDGRLDGIDERLEVISERIGDYERERAERIQKENSEKVDKCEHEPKYVNTSDAELHIRDLERELELIKNNQEVYNLGYKDGIKRRLF